MRNYLTIGPYYFKFRLVSSIICLFGIIILAYLGTWQLNRSIEKKQNILLMQEKINGIPQRLSVLHDPRLIRDRFTPVIIYGVYLSKYTFLLDNQVYNKQVGYRILTVLQSPYLNKWLLVDRGWVAQGASRKTLPVIQDSFGLQDFVGIVNTIPTGIVLQSDQFDPNATWPLVIQALDLDLIEKYLQHPVYDFVVQPRPNENSPYPIPPIDFGMPSDKHLGYALQWYSFAALVLIYYVLTSFSKTKGT